MTPMAVPSEARAVRIGSRAAKSEANTSPSTIRASSTPGPVPPIDCLLEVSATWPATATVMPFPSAVLAVFTKCCASVTSMAWACSLKVTVAKAIVPSLLTWVAAVACSSGVAPAGG